MDEATLRLNQIECDKCSGTGLVYGIDIYLLIRRWRLSRDIPSKTLAVVAKIPYSRYSKFENGRQQFSDVRIRKIIEILSGEWPAILRRKAKSV